MHVLMSVTSETLSHETYGFTIMYAIAIARTATMVSVTDMRCNIHVYMCTYTYANEQCTLMFA